MHYLSPPPGALQFAHMNSFLDPSKDLTGLRKVEVKVGVSTGCPWTFLDSYSTGICPKSFSGFRFRQGGVMHSLKRKFVCGGACLALIALSACATQVAAPPSTNSPMAKGKKPAHPLLSRIIPFTSHPETKAVAPPAPISPSSPPTVPLPVAEKPSSPVLFSSIPDDPSIQLYIDYFQYADHRRFKEWLERSHEYLPYIHQTLREMGLPEDLAYVSLIESGFSARAYSRTGAAGLWQFMRGTGVKYGLKVNWWIDQRRDPIQATRSAAQYLKDLHDEFDSWELALAAYNAGEGRVANAVSRAGTKNYWKLRQTREFSSETRNYIPKLIAALTIAKNPAKYGFTDLSYHPAVIVRQKEIHRSVDIRRLARAMNMSVSEFLVYNPQFIRWATPPRLASVTVNVPVELEKGFSKRLASLPSTAINPDVPVYRVESGDSLWSIAHRFHVPLRKLIAANRLSSRHLSLRQKLLIPVTGNSRPVHLASGRSSHHRFSGWIDHRIRRGDSLYLLAHHYRTSVREILAKNHLRSSRILRVGDHIMIPSR